MPVETLTRFLSDPLVAPIYALAVVSLATFVLAIYRNVQQGSFDLHKTPQILDTLVVQKVFPLAIMGVAAYIVTDPATKSLITAAYAAGAAAAVLAEAKNLIDYIRTGTDGVPLAIAAKKPCD